MLSDGTRGFLIGMMKKKMMTEFEKLFIEHPAKLTANNSPKVLNLVLYLYLLILHPLKHFLKSRFFAIHKNPCAIDAACNPSGENKSCYE